LSYTIIENIVPISIQDQLEDMFQYQTKWNYVSSTSGNDEGQLGLDPLIKECPQLIHQAMWGENPDPTSVSRIYFRW
jgi:hypothetical protein